MHFKRKMGSVLRKKGMSDRGNGGEVSTQAGEAVVG